MNNASQIREHMDVVGSDGQHVGIVDKVEGNRIKLTKSDPVAGGEHHYLSMDQIASVEMNTIRLTVSGDQARRQWQQTASGRQ